MNMKTILAAVVTMGVLACASSALAQRVITYYPPAPVTVARPVYSVPVTTYYAPAPAVVYRRAPVVYRPAVPVAPAPTVYAAPVYGPPVYGFYSPYGGPEVRVPGQPIRNALRAIIP